MSAWPGTLPQQLRCLGNEFYETETYEREVNVGTPIIVGPCLLASAKRIEELEAALGRLVCLDVTTRKGQAAFAEWRNKYVRKSKP